MPAPKSLTQQQMQVLATVLPGATEPCDPSEEHEPCQLAPVDVSQFGKSGHGMGGGSAYDEDEDGGEGGGQRVQCAQQ